MKRPVFIKLVILNSIYSYNDNEGYIYWIFGFCVLSKFGFHHFIFALLPILFIYIDNINELQFKSVLVPIFITLTIIAAIWLILKLIFGERKSSIILTLLVIVFIVLAHVRGSIISEDNSSILFLASNYVLVPIFGSIAILGIIFIIRKNIPSEITSIINVVSIAVIAFMIFQSSMYYSQNQYDLEIVDEFLDVKIVEFDKKYDRPDVFLILLDAYSGETILEEDYGFNNSQFYKSLEERDFHIQKNSLSNYPNTEFALPSLMNMNYVDFLIDIVGKESKDKTLAQKIWDENKVMEVFYSNGYDVFAFHHENGAASNMVKKEFCKYPLEFSTEFGYIFAQYYMPISMVRTLILDEIRYYTIDCTFDEMKNFEKDGDSPTYVHMHISFPHPSFVYDSEGNRISIIDASYNRYDKKFKDAYIDQSIYANKKSLEIIDALQGRYPEAVIILMSDHGGRFGINWDDPKLIDYYRGFNNLSAFYFPGKDYDDGNISPVNIFRHFFNLYFDSEYEILDDRQIWYSPETPYIQHDVTDKILPLS